MSEKFLQVVAGTNYKLLLDIATSQNQKERLEAVVYGAHCTASHAATTKQSHAVAKAMYQHTKWT